MEKSLSNQTAAMYSPLVLAYLGDALYELIVRERIVRRGNCQVNKMHHGAVRYVKAAAQARIARYLEEQNLLEESEKAAFRRGRNAHSKTTARNASVIDYRMATALEALLGYLWLSGERERMKELVEVGIHWLEQEEKIGE